MKLQIRNSALRFEEIECCIKYNENNSNDNYFTFDIVHYESKRCSIKETIQVSIKETIQVSKKEYSNNNENNTIMGNHSFMSSHNMGLFHYGNEKVNKPIIEKWLYKLFSLFVSTTFK